MTRRLLYVAHPVAATDAQIEARSDAYIHRATAERIIRRDNIRCATRWLGWLRASFPEDTFIAPWIASMQSLEGDDSPELREAGLVDDCVVVGRCDGIVLCGNRVSGGMARERDHGRASSHDDFIVYDITVLAQREPPAIGGHGLDIGEWMAQIAFARPS